MKIKLGLVFFVLFCAVLARAETSDAPFQHESFFNAEEGQKFLNDGNEDLQDTIFWEEYKRLSEKQAKIDQMNGISYILSGAIALVGGHFGYNYSADPLEKGIYTVFQSIGIASIGWGAYTWRVGGDERMMYRTLARVEDMTPDMKSQFLASYYLSKKERQRELRVIQILTHSLIATYNIYYAYKQDNKQVKDALFFIGGVNILAAVSFAF